MNSFSRDAGIPILTEIISPAATNAFPDTDVAPPFDVEPQPPEQTANPPASQEPQDHQAFEEEAIARLSDEEWHRLERRIRERILSQVLARIDAMLEQRIRDSLADVLQIALEGLTEQIRAGLHHSLDDIISCAVSQEITRMQSSKK
ncbi:hypothetical protein Q8A64_05790 [Oxalobacteraceae bacterium R-40]|uniref:Uncharacterized protein n=1 Tax=Keguizhuia sedimenti TaxID=3064264 RepID=A0ABU1BNB2_9BURK|nr:hypothetical protein [Oxalobacteraceae bacterium R-40]